MQRESANCRRQVVRGVRPPPGSTTEEKAKGSPTVGHTTSRAASIEHSLSSFASSPRGCEGEAHTPHHTQKHGTHPQRTQQWRNEGRRGEGAIQVQLRSSGEVERGGTGDKGNRQHATTWGKGAHEAAQGPGGVRKCEQQRTGEGERRGDGDDEIETLRGTKHGDVQCLIRR